VQEESQEASCTREDRTMLRSAEGHCCTRCLLPLLLLLNRARDPVVHPLLIAAAMAATCVGPCVFGRSVCCVLDAAR